jgi:replicative DNA helicase
MTRRKPEPIEHLRAPPHSNEAEQAVLGGLMLRGDALLEVVDWLTEDDFYRRDHRAIYRAMCDLAQQQKPFDAVTLGEWFIAQNLADLVGGSSYVIELANTTPSAANVAAYAEIVREKSALRHLITIGTELAGEGFDAKGMTAELIAGETLRKLSQLGGIRPAGAVSAKSIVGTWFADMQRRYDEHEDLSGLPTPWAKLNELTNGLQGGDLYFLAGRPSMGKTVLGWQLAQFNAIGGGGRTYVGSLEMRASQLVQRGVASISEIPHRSLRKPSLITDAEWGVITEAATKIGAAPLVIDDQPSLTPQQIVARIEREHMRDPLTLVVVDHLHEMRLPGKDRVNELADATGMLRTLAKKLGIPVVLLGQLNRVSTNRTGGHADRRPTMAELRGSGAIEEKADVILLLHREDYYDRSTYLKGVVEVIVEKGRDLPRGEIVYLHNRYDIMRADDWEGPLPTPKDADEKKPKRKNLAQQAADYQAPRE